MSFPFGSSVYYVLLTRNFWHVSLWYHGEIHLCFITNNMHDRFFHICTALWLRVIRIVFSQTPSIIMIIIAAMPGMVVGAFMMWSSLGPFTNILFLLGTLSDCICPSPWSWAWLCDCFGHHFHSNFNIQSRVEMIWDTLRQIPFFFLKEICNGYVM